MTVIIVSTCFGVLLIIGIVLNNQIIAKKNQIDNAFGSIEIYLKKRFDLIPNLIALLNKYLTHEREILLETTKLRSKIGVAKSPQEKIEASNQLTKLVGGLNVNVENYPDLKADKQFANIQFELADIEDQISAARRAYNASVIDYNNKIQMFPGSIVASIRKDKKNTLLEIPKEEQKEVKIDQLLK